MNDAWPWVTLALLGAYHGLNPAMGWLFAVAIGLQEKRRTAVLGALWPIALGHAAAITLTIILLLFVQYFLPLRVLKITVAIILFATGLYRLFRASHPRGAGMRMGAKGLFLWSFLMAAGHGAGLMLMPVLLTPSMQHSTIMQHTMIQHTMTNATPAALPAASAPLNIYVLALAVLVHTLSLLAVAGVLAIVVFETYASVGLGPLKNAWLNFDLVWAIALLLAGCATLLL